MFAADENRVIVEPRHFVVIHQRIPHDHGIAFPFESDLQEVFDQQRRRSDRQSGLGLVGVSDDRGQFVAFGEHEVDQPSSLLLPGLGDVREDVYR